MKFKKSNNWNYQSNSQSSYNGKFELEIGEESLKNYNLSVVRKIKMEIDGASHQDYSDKILEFGAGIGVLAKIWRTEFKISPTCIDIDSRFVEELKTIGFEAYRSLNEVNKMFAACYSSNVLEHIEDDVYALKEIRKILSPGGILVIYVPALPILFSGLDTKVGHNRRYTRKELVQKIKLAGYDVQDAYYNDCLGVLATFITRIFGFNSQSGLGSSKSLQIYDKYLLPLSNILDSLVMKHIIGKNLLVIAKVNNV